MSEQHPATGPISPAEMQALADAPYGRAAVELRKHDPLWGHTAGDADALPPLRKWRVVYHQEVTMRGSVEVEARTEDEAITLADAMNVVCDDPCDDGGTWMHKAEPVE